MKAINFSQRGKDGLLGIQHLISMFGATTLVPLLTGLNVGVALFTAGLGTLIFHFLTNKKVPVFLGSSFAFIPGIIAVGNSFGLQYAQGGIFVAGIAYLFFALLVYKIGIETINKYLPKHVIGTMIAIIGFSLIPVAINMSSYHFPIAIATLTLACMIMYFAKGFTRQMVILVAISFGYLMSYFAGMVDFTPIIEAQWFSIPSFSAPKFNATAIFMIVPLVLATFMEHIGDITANGAIVGKKFTEDPGLHKTLIGDGIATAVAGLLGGPANTTYGENTGVLAITKNYNPQILRLAAAFAIGLAFIGKIAGVLASIPVFVLGGISILLFSMIAKIGIMTLYEDKSWEDFEKIIIVTAMLILGFSSVEFWVFSGMSLAAIFGIASNGVLTLRR